MNSNLVPDSAPQLPIAYLADNSFSVMCIVKSKHIRNAAGCMISSVLFSAEACVTLLLWKQKVQDIQGSLQTSNSIDAFKQLICIPSK